MKNSTIEVHKILSSSSFVAFLWKNEKGWPVEYVSENVKKIIGISAEEFINKKIKYSDLIHPDDIKKVTAEVMLNSTIKGLSHFTHEPYRIILPDKKIKWIEDKKTFRRDKNGNITHYQGIIQDITRRIGIEEALIRSEQYLEDIIESIQDGISVLDKDLTIQRVNSVMNRWYKQNIPLEGKKCFECYHNSKEPCNPCPTIRALKSGKTEHNIVRGLFGSPIEWIELYSYPIKNRDTGEITGVVEFVRDITEKKRLENQLLHAQKMETLGTLAGGIAHDFNNIMQAIFSQTQLLLLDMKKENSDRELLQGIEESVEKAKKLTRQLLLFSRKIESILDPVNLNNEIARITTILKRTLPQSIRIKIKPDKDLNLIKADSAQIEQLIMNLAINAHHAMPGGGMLLIETQNIHIQKSSIDPQAPEGEYVSLSVSDSGHGMNEEIQKHIFDPFFTTKEVGMGTGLGMSSVYGIVKNHGGYITCDSEPGLGTNFTMYFPVLETIDALLKKEKPKASLPGGTETILLVDDNSTLLELGVSMLKRFGYNTITASSGDDALEIYKDKGSDIDLVIMDLDMPGMDGLTCTKHIKKIEPHAKIVIASGYSSEKISQMPDGEIATDFIGKPYNLEEILKKIRSCLV